MCRLHRRTCAVDELTTGTLTSIVIRTAVSGARLEMGNIYYPNELCGYNSSGGMSMLLGPESIWTDYGYFDHIGHTSGVCELMAGKVVGRASFPSGINGTLVHNSNAPTNWTDLDLSGVVGSRQALVLLALQNNGSLSTNYRFRPNGSSRQQTATVDNYPGSLCTRINNGVWGYSWAYTSSSGVIEWDADQTSSTAVYVVAYVS